MDGGEGPNSGVRFASSEDPGPETVSTGMHDVPLPQEAERAASRAVSISGRKSALKAGSLEMPAMKDWSAGIGAGSGMSRPSCTSGGIADLMPVGVFVRFQGVGEAIGGVAGDRIPEWHTGSDQARANVGLSRGSRLI